MSEHEKLTTDTVPSIGFLFEWNAEITRFYLSRFQKCGELPWRLATCRSTDDTRAVQAEFIGDLVAGYREEATRLAEIADARDEVDYSAELLKAQQDAAVIVAQAKAQAETILASARQRAEEITAIAKEPMRKSA